MVAVLYNFLSELEVLQVTKECPERLSNIIVTLSKILESLDDESTADMVKPLHVEIVLKISISVCFKSFLISICFNLNFSAYSVPAMDELSDCGRQLYKHGG